MLTKREIISEVCIRAGVPCDRFRVGDLSKTELYNVIVAAQTLSPREQGIFDFILTELRTARSGQQSSVSET